MPYIRVLPRDLFNEASLLKCYGRLWILLEKAGQHVARFETEDCERFEIEQDESSGALYVRNVVFTVNGNRVILTRPLNSRGAWPLYAETPDESVPVFDDDGNFSDKFLAFIGAKESILRRWRARAL